MKSLKEYNIPFVGLKDGEHQFSYQIDKKFFESLEYDEFADVDALINLKFVKTATMLELTFSVSGNVEVPCDLSGEYFKQTITGELPLLVKFGQEYNDENEEILIVPHGEYQINVQQYIYELIILSVPLKRVHPQVVDGTLEIQEYNDASEVEESKEEETEVDPRWNKLKQLLDKK